MGYRAAKRILDLIVTLPALVLLSPVLLLVAIMVRLRLGQPVIFRQERAGLYGKPFCIYKFRTMTNARDAEGNLLSDAKRLLPFGAWLRSTSLDELPQLFNVLIGDMSLVGPRPLYVRYIPRYSPEQRKRLEVRPGITGLAQLRGRNSLEWDERFALDVHYVQTVCLYLDVGILFKTIFKVIQRSEINQGGNATMTEFLGPGA